MDTCDDWGHCENHASPQNLFSRKNYSKHTIYLTSDLLFPKKNWFLILYNYRPTFCIQIYKLKLIFGLELFYVSTYCITHMVMCLSTLLGWSISSLWVSIVFYDQKPKLEPCRNTTRVRTRVIFSGNRLLIRMFTHRKGLDQRQEWVGAMPPLPPKRHHGV
jgi:hypothetical protein